MQRWLDEGQHKMYEANILKNIIFQWFKKKKNLKETFDKYISQSKIACTNIIKRETR